MAKNNKNVNLIGYTKNFTKSVAYSTVDRYKDLSPTLKSFADENSELGKIVFASIKDFKGTAKKVKDYTIASDIGQASIQTFKSINEDIRSGKFYNKERIDEMEVLASGDLLKMDDDSSMDMSSFDFDIDDDDSSYGLDDLSDDFDDVGEKVTTGIASSISRTGMAIVQSNTEIASKNQKFNELLAGKINLSLASINSTMLDLTRYQQESMKTLVDNSNSFFSRSVELDTERNKLLKELVEMQAKMQVSIDSQNAKKSSSLSYNDIVTDGAPNLKLYGKKILDNINAASMGLGDLNKSMGGNMLMTMAGSPMKFVSDTIAKKIIPDAMTSAIKSLDGTIQGAFGTLMSRFSTMSKDEDNMLAKIMGDVLGINTGVKTDVDTSKYYKGAMPWDGESKQALTYVLPTLLSKLLSAQTGDYEMIYDYKSGKWTNSRVIATSNSTKDMAKSASKSASSDLTEVMKGLIRETDFESKDSMKKFYQDWDNMMYTFFSNGTMYDFSKKFEDLNMSDLGISDYNSFYKIAAVMETIKNSTAGKSLLMQMNDKIHSSKASHNSKINSMEANNLGVIKTLFDNFQSGQFVNTTSRGELIENAKDLKSNEIAKNITLRTTAHNNKVEGYLQYISNELQWIRLNHNRFGSMALQTSPNALSTVNIATPTTSANNILLPSGASHTINNSIVDRSEVLKLNNVDISNNIGRSRYKTLDQKAREQSSREEQNYSRLLQKKFDNNYNKNLKGYADPDTYSHLQKRLDTLIAERDIRNVDEIKQLQQQIATIKKKGFIPLSEEGITDADELEKIRKYNRDHAFRKDILFDANSYTDLDEVKRKNIYQENISMRVSIEDLAKKVEANKKKKESKNPIFDMLMKSESVDDGFKDLIGRWSNLVDAPTKMLTAIVDRANERTFNILWGSPEEGRMDPKSFMGNLTAKLTSTFANFNDFLKEEIFEPFKTTLFGEDGITGVISDTKDKIFDMLKLDEDKLEDAITKFIFGSKDEETGIRDGGMFGSKAQYIKDAFSSTGKYSLDKFLEVDPTGEKREKILKLIELKEKKNSYMSAEEAEATEVVSRKDLALYSPFVANAKRKALSDKQKQILEKMRSSRTENIFVPQSIRQQASNVTIPDSAADIENMATGGIVKKTGVVALSKGELVIPSELNPFYKGTTNKLKELKKEEEAKSKFMKFITGSSKNHDAIPGYSTGTAAAEPVDIDDLTSGRRNRHVKSKSRRGKVRKPASGDDAAAAAPGAGSIDDSVDIDDSNKIKFGHVLGYEATSLAQFLLKGLGSTGTEIKDRLLSSSEAFANAYGKLSGRIEDIVNDDLDNQDILFGDMVEDVTGDFSKYFPSMLGSAIVGSGVSLITGAIGGPLLGAAVGAGVDLAVSSEKVRDWLFGKEIDGERQGNIFSKHLSNNITKYFPDMAKGSVIGGITSILPFVPGGPVSGIILGSAVGFAKNNDKVLNTLFGEFNTETNARDIGGLIPKKTRDFIKNSIPEGVLGAGIGLFAGPYGLVGNAILGGSIGILSQTNKFQDAMFGEIDPATGERDGGVIGTIKDKFVLPLVDFGGSIIDRFTDWFKKDIATPLSSAVKPLAKQLSLMGEKIVDTLKSTVGDLFRQTFKIRPEEKIAHWAFKGVTAPIKFAADTLAKPAGSLISAPFRAAGALGDHLRLKQIKSGNANYMTAQERNAYREERRTGIVYDKYTEDIYETLPDGRRVLVHRKGDYKEDELGRRVELKRNPTKYFNRTFNRTGRKDKFKEFDENLIDLDKDSLSDLSESLDLLGKSNDGLYDGLQQKTIKTIKKKIDTRGVEYKDKKKLLSYLGKNNIKGAMKFIRSLDIDDAEKEGLLKDITSEYSSFSALDKVKNDSTGYRQELYSKLQSKYGFKDINDKTLGKYKGLIDQELKVKNEMDPIDKLNEKQQDRHNEIVDLIKRTISAIEGINDPKQRERDAISKFKENMKQARKRRGLLFDSGDSGIFGDPNNEIGAELDSVTGKYRYYSYDKNLYDDYSAVPLEDRNYYDDYLKSKAINLDSNSISATPSQYSTNSAISGSGNTATRNIVTRAGIRAKHHLTRLWTKDEEENAKYQQFKQESKGSLKRDIDRFIPQKVKNAASNIKQGAASKFSDIKDGIYNGVSDLDLFKSKQDRIDKEEKEGKARWVPDQLGNLIKNIRGRDGWQVDNADRQNKKVSKLREKTTGVVSTIANKIKDIGSDISSGFSRFFKIDKERDGFLKKTLKIGTKLLGIFTIIGFMPILETWWTKTVSPKVKEFWSDSIYPKIKGIVDPIIPGLAKAAIGIDNAIRSIPTTINNLWNKLKSFMSEDFPRIWTNKIIPFYGRGAEWVADKVGFATELIIKSLPTVLVGVGKGLVRGFLAALKVDMVDLFSSFGNKRYKDISESAVGSSTVSSSGSPVSAKLSNFTGASGLFKAITGKDASQVSGEDLYAAPNKSSIKNFYTNSNTNQDYPVASIEKQTSESGSRGYSSSDINKYTNSFVKNIDTSSIYNDNVISAMAQSATVSGLNHNYAATSYDSIYQSVNSSDTENKVDSYNEEESSNKKVVTSGGFSMNGIRTDSSTGLSYDSNDKLIPGIYLDPSTGNYVDYKSQAFLARYGDVSAIEKYQLESSKSSYGGEYNNYNIDENGEVLYNNNKVSMQEIKQVDQNQNKTSILGNVAGAVSPGTVGGYLASTTARQALSGRSLALTTKIATGLIPKSASKNIISKVAKNTARAIPTVLSSAVVKTAATHQLKNISTEIIKGYTETAAKNNGQQIFTKIYNVAIKNKTIMAYITKCAKDTAKKTGATTVTEAMVQDALKKACLETEEAIINSYSSAILKNTIMKNVAKYLVPGAFALYDFYDGYNNASSYLGVLDEDLQNHDYNLLIRLAVGIVAAILGFVTAGLLPISLVASIFVKVFLPIIDKTAADELDKMKQIAVLQLQRENNKAGTNYSLYQRNKQARNAIGTKTWNTVKGALGFKVKSDISDDSYTGYQNFTGYEEIGSSTPITLENYGYAQSSVTSPLENKVAVSTPTVDLSKVQMFVPQTYTASSYSPVFSGSGSGLDVDNVKSIDSTDNNKSFQSNLVSQIDSKYKDIRFNTPADTKSQTIGDSGCAPAVATMAVNSITNSDNITLPEAANKAIEYNTKEVNGGVNAEYFDKLYKDNGMRAVYAEKKQEIAKLISKGSPVVLLGRDENNTSKVISPFGKNNHYVLVTGYSKDGTKLFINDPEQKVSNIQYPAEKIISSSMLGIGSITSRYSISSNFKNKYTSYQGSGTYSESDINNKLRKHGKETKPLTLKELAGKKVDSRKASKTKFKYSSKLRYSQYSGGASAIDLSSVLFDPTTATNKSSRSYSNTSYTSSNNTEVYIPEGYFDNPVSIGRTTYIVNEVVYGIMVTQSTCNYSAVNWTGDSSIRVGIFQWGGKEAASILKEICLSNQVACKELLGASLYRQLTSGKPLNGKKLTDTSKNAIIDLLSSQEGQQIQLSRAIKQAIGYIQTAKSRFTDAKSVILWCLLNHDNSDIGSYLLSAPVDKLPEATMCNNLFNYFISGFSDYKYSSEKYNKMYNFAYSSICASTDTSDYDSEILEGLTSTSSSDKKSNGSWVSNLVTAVTKMIQAVFGIGDPEAKDETSNIGSNEAYDYLSSSYDPDNSYIDKPTLINIQNLMDKANNEEYLLKERIGYVKDMCNIDTKTGIEAFEYGCPNLISIRNGIVDGGILAESSRFVSNYTTDKTAQEKIRYLTNSCVNDVISSLLSKLNSKVIGNDKVSADIFTELYKAWKYLIIANCAIEDIKKSLSIVKNSQGYTPSGFNSYSAISNLIPSSLETRSSKEMCELFASFAPPGFNTNLLNTPSSLKVNTPGAYTTDVVLNSNASSSCFSNTFFKNILSKSSKLLFKLANCKTRKQLLELVKDESSIVEYFKDIAIEEDYSKYSAEEAAAKMKDLYSEDFVRNVELMSNTNIPTADRQKAKAEAASYLSKLDIKEKQLLQQYNKDIMDKYYNTVSISNKTPIETNKFSSMAGYGSGLKLFSGKASENNSDNTRMVTSAPAKSPAAPSISDITSSKTLASDVKQKTKAVTSTKAATTAPSTNTTSSNSKLSLPYNTSTIWGYTDQESLDNVKSILGVNFTPRHNDGIASREYIRAVYDDLPDEMKASTADTSNNNRRISTINNITDDDGITFNDRWKAMTYGISVDDVRVMYDNYGGNFDTFLKSGYARKYNVKDIENTYSKYYTLPEYKRDGGYIQHLSEYGKQKLDELKQSSFYQDLLSKESYISENFVGLDDYEINAGKMSDEEIAETLATYSGTDPLKTFYSFTKGSYKNRVDDIKQLVDQAKENAIAFENRPYSKGKEEWASDPYNRPTNPNINIGEYNNIYDILLDNGSINDTDRILDILYKYKDQDPLNTWFCFSDSGLLYNYKKKYELQLKSIISKNGKGSKILEAAKGSFVSQNDYNTVGFSDGESVSSSGCGPAVATMAINNAYGKNSNMISSVALADKYKTDQGVTSDYFEDILPRNGLNAEYIDNSNGTIKNHLAKGEQVILMGKDAANNSKSKSPFGPGNHYVLATGIDNDKVVINDPEQHAPVEYKSSILNKAKMAMRVAGGAAKLDTINAVYDTPTGTTSYKKPTTTKTFKPATTTTSKPTSTSSVSTPTSTYNKFNNITSAPNVALDDNYYKKPTTNPVAVESISSSKYNAVIMAICIIGSTETGNNFSCVTNDSGAISVGFMQWNHTRAYSLLRNIFNRLGTQRCAEIFEKHKATTVYNKICSHDLKSGSKITVTASEKAALTEILGTEAGVTTQVELAISEIYSYMSSYKYSDIGTRILATSLGWCFGTGSKVFNYLTGDLTCEQAYNVLRTHASSHKSRWDKTYSALKGLSNMVMPAEPPSAAEVAAALNTNLGYTTSSTDITESVSSYYTDSINGTSGSLSSSSTDSNSSGSWIERLSNAVSKMAYSYFNKPTKSTSGSTNSIGGSYEYTSSENDYQYQMFDDDDNTSSQSKSNPLGEAALSVARSQIGKPYVWGAQGPNSFDCSGLVMYSFKQCGVVISTSGVSDRRSRNMSSNTQGTVVSGLSSAIPGDVLFFADSSGSVTHTGIYAGNGYMVDASTNANCVSERLVSATSLKLHNIKRYTTSTASNTSSRSTDVNAANGSGISTTAPVTGKGASAKRYIDRAVSKLSRSKSGKGSSLVNNKAILAASNNIVSKAMGNATGTNYKDSTIVNKNLISTTQILNSTRKSVSPTPTTTVARGSEDYGYEEYATQTNTMVDSSANSDMVVLLNSVITVLSSIAVNTGNTSELISLLSKLLSSDPSSKDKDASKSNSKAVEAYKSTQAQISLLMQNSVNSDKSDIEEVLKTLRSIVSP